MKPIVRRGLGLLTVIAFVTIWAVSSGMSRRALRVRTCSGKETLEVIVKDSLERKFVGKDDVERWLDEEYHAYAGLRLDSVDLAKVESIILGHSAVKSCEAWLTDDGRLHIALSQREPVLRFDDGTNGYYCDADSFIFPLQARFSVDVPLVDGQIPLRVPRGYKGAPDTSEGSQWLSGMLGLCRAMKDGGWTSRVKKLHVRQSGDIVLHPVEGSESFVFGPATRVKEKLALMERYYTTVQPVKNYKEVDLRYRGQIVCR